MIFLGLFVVFWIAMTSALAYESGLIATIFLATFLGICQIFQVGFAPFDYIIHNPLSALIAVGVYFGLGVAFGVYKWVRFVYAEVAAAREAGGADKLRRSYSIPLKVRDHKARLMRWMGYWPFTFLWSLLHDPVEFVYNLISGGLQRISDRAFANV